jgi:tetratricopeptide (TPR) repeat protein
MARSWGVVAGTLVLTVSMAAVPAAAAEGVLVRYGFDDDNLATGPDTFAVFEKSKGRVHLSTAFRTSGYRSIEIRDVAGDGSFPELQGYFPRRESGRLYAHFALLVATPLEQLNIALAGPEWFSMKKGGVAFWLQTRGGWLCQYSDSIPMRLLQVRPFAWYLVDLAYDITAGTYDLAIREEGRSDPVVALKSQPNAFSEPGSAVDKFSFIGDNGHDTSNVDYYVDDILLTVDQPIVMAPFVAPGRRKLFFDTWSDARALLRSRPVCLPAIDLSDFGLTLEAIESLKRDGLLATLQDVIEGRPVTVPDREATESVSALHAVLLWKGGCSALRRGDAEAALERFTKALERVPGGTMYEVSAVLSLAALGRWDQVDLRLAGLHAAWKDDPRLPLLLAMLGLARPELEAAERPLRAPAARVADDPRLECALVALSRDFGPRIVDMVRSRFPADWRSCLDAALLPEEYYDVLLARKSHDAAGRYAARMAERLRAMSLPASGWVERIGDAAFLEKDYARALARYQESARQEPPDAALLLKISDTFYLLGNLENERVYREAIYGSLHEEQEHPKDPAIPQRPEGPVDEETPDEDVD